MNVIKSVIFDRKISICAALFSQAIIYDSTTGDWHHDQIRTERLKAATYPNSICVFWCVNFFFLLQGLETFNYKFVFQSLLGRGEWSGLPPSYTVSCLFFITCLLLQLRGYNRWASWLASIIPTPASVLPSPPPRPPGLFQCAGRRCVLLLFCQGSLWCAFGM